MMIWLVLNPHLVVHLLLLFICSSYKWENGHPNSSSAHHDQHRRNTPFLSFLSASQEIPRLLGVKHCKFDVFFQQLLLGLPVQNRDSTNSLCINMSYLGMKRNLPINSEIQKNCGSPNQTKKVSLP